MHKRRHRNRIGTSLARRLRTCERAVDINNRPVNPASFDPAEIPRIRFGLLRDRLRLEKRSAMLEEPQTDRVGSSWDEILKAYAHRFKVHQLIALAVFLVRVQDGRIATDDDGYPLHITYAEAAITLHTIDPMLFCNEKGKCPSRQTVKDYVVTPFARAWFHFLKESQPKAAWTFEKVKSRVVVMFGDSRKSVPHNNQYCK